MAAKPVTPATGPKPPNLVAAISLSGDTLDALVAKRQEIMDHIPVLSQRIDNLQPDYDDIAGQMGVLQQELTSCQNVAYEITEILKQHGVS